LKVFTYFLLLAISIANVFGNSFSAKKDSVLLAKLLQTAESHLRTDSMEVIKQVSLALPLAKKLKNIRAELKAYGLLGQMAYYNSNFSKAGYYCNLRLEICEKSKFVEDIRLSILNTQALIAMRIGKPDQTLSLTQQSIHGAEKAIANGEKGFEKILYMGLNLNANVLFSQFRDKPRQSARELTEAKNYFFRCLGLCKKHATLRHNLPTVYHNIAGCYVEQNLGDSAMYYFKQEEKMALELDRKVDLIGSYVAQAELLFKGNRLTAAEELLMKAQPLANKYKDPDHLITIPYLLAKIYAQTGKKKESERLLYRALELSKQKNLPESVKLVLEDLYFLEKGNGNYQEALQLYEEKQLISDSLYSQAKTKIINEINTKYQTEKKEQTILNLQAEKKMQYVIISMLILTLLTSGLAIRNKLQSLKLEKDVTVQSNIAKTILAEKMQQEMQSKQKELSLQSMYLDQRRNILKEVKLNLTKKEGTESLDKKELIKEIDASLRFENDWKKFNAHFDELHPQFFRKLLAIKSNLTALDLRHCAYVKMGLSTKQVANLLSVSPESVTMSRVRLKKKLKLSQDLTLLDYFNTLLQSPDH
jgi:MalT-like TPR region